MSLVSLIFMRKKCISCGFINFINIDSCKKCNSNKLEKISPSEDLLLRNLPSESLKKPKVPKYVKHFSFAIIIELAALILTIPFLASASMKHSGNAPTSVIEVLFALIAFALHFPTISITYAITVLTNLPFIIFTPITQVFFLFYWFAYKSRKKKSK